MVRSEDRCGTNQGHNTNQSGCYKNLGRDCHSKSGGHKDEATSDNRIGGSAGNLPAQSPLQHKNNNVVQDKLNITDESKLHTSVSS